MKRILLLMLLCTSSTIAMAQTTWTGLGGNTNWNNVDNWDTGLIPTLSDDVIIPTNFTVTINVAALVKSIDIQGNTIVEKSAPLNFSEPSFIASGVVMDWNTSDIAGNSILTNNGTINVSSNNVFLNGNVTLTNNGSINFINSGDLFIASDCTLNNTASGIIDFQGANSGISESGPGVNLLTNEGLIRTSFISADQADQATINVELKNNDGTIQVEVGTLNLSNGIADAMELTDGIYNVSAGANLDWDSAITVSGTLTGNLTGGLNWRSLVRVNAPNTATFDFTGNETVTWVSGTLDGGGTLVNESIIAVQNSNVGINGMSTLTNNATIDFEGTGDIFIQNDSVLNNSVTGTIDFKGDNSGISESGAGLNILNNEGVIKTSFTSADPTDQASINVELKNNDGSIQVEVGTLNLSNGIADAIELTDGIYNVSAGANLDWDSAITISGTLTGNISGLLNWRSTVMVNALDTATFNFTGTETITWVSGSLDGGGHLVNENIIVIQNSNVFISGLSTLTNNAAINFEGTGDIFIQHDSTLNNSVTGIIDFQVGNSGISESGAGLNILNNEGMIKTSFISANPTDQATINVELKNNDGTIQVEVGILNLTNGIADAIELTDGVYNVSAGANLDWDSAITVSGILTGNISGQLNWRSTVRVNAADTATFDFTGTETVTWASGGLDGGGTLINESTIGILSSNVFINGTSTFTNNDTIQFILGGDIFIQSDSVLNNSVTGIIDFQGDTSGISQSGAGINLLSNAGLLLCSSSNLSVINVEVINTGIIEAAFGRLNFAGTLDHQAGGIVKGIATFDMPTVVNFTNNGTFAPGASPGTLTVNGNYISTPSTILDIELNGLTPDIEHDVLAITGTSVVFEGTVDVSMGFEGTIGDTFTIATTTGTIATANLQSPIENVEFDGKRYTFDISYPDNNKVVLTISDKLDILPPNVITQDIVVELNESGNASILASEIDNGSTDNCTPTNELQFSLDIDTFTCSDLGDNTVQLTVTDNDNNFATVSATVTVIDVIDPSVVTQDIIVELDASGNASILASEIDNGSNDNCSVTTLDLDISNFTCSDLGENTVELTVTDQSENSASATATVSVLDNETPTVITQDIIVELDASGNASILASEIDNGSADNCSVSSLEIDISEFNCADLGDNTVELTVIDQSGNSDSAAATVNVIDIIDPTITCPMGFTISNAGDFTLPDYVLDNTVSVSDNCDFTVEQTPIPGTVLPDGEYDISFVVTDSSGNTATCIFELKVEDTTLGVDDFELSHTTILVFPNPVVNTLSIKNTTGLQLIDLEIIDVAGKLINRVNLKSMDNTMQIPLEGYANGMYFVKINSQNSSITKKIVKQ